MSAVGRRPWRVNGSISQLIWFIPAGYWLFSMVCWLLWAWIFSRLGGTVAFSGLELTARLVYPPIFAMWALVFCLGMMWIRQHDQLFHVRWIIGFSVICLVAAGFDVITKNQQGHVCQFGPPGSGGAYDVYCNWWPVTLVQQR